jgi:uncharacterized membrane protein
MKNKIFIASMTALIVTLLTAIVLAQDLNNCPMGYGMMYGLYGGYGTGFMLLSWITYVLFIILIIAGIYWLIKSADSKKKYRR